MDSLKVNSSTKLTVVMNVSLTANVDELSVQEKMSPAVEMPLNTNYFIIEKLNEEERPGKIEETKDIQVPADIRILIIIGAVIAVLIFTLIYLLIFTVEPTIEDIYLKNFNKIFKNHGSRLVALNGKAKTSDKNCCNVRSVDDLVRIADELGKPIFYEYNTNHVEIEKLYVIDDNWIYILNINDYILYELIGNDVLNKLLNEQKGQKNGIIQNLSDGITEALTE